MTQQLTLRRQFVLAMLLVGAMVSSHSQTFAQCKTWLKLGQSSIDSISGKAAIATDAAGNVYMAYNALHTSRVKVQKFNGISWTTLDTNSLSIGTSPQVAVDNAGIPYLLYSRPDSGGIVVVKKYNGSSWIDVGTMPVITTDANSLTIDASGNPWVSFRDAGSGSGDSILVYHYNGSSWVDVSPTDIYSWETKMVLDPSGNPYVAFKNLFGKISVAHYNGSSWDLVGVDGLSVGYTIGEFSIAVNASNVPYVAFFDDGSGLHQRVMKFNGTSWVSVGSSIYNGYSGSIAIDATGVPYLCYVEQVYLQFSYRIRKFNGTDWEYVGEGAPVDAMQIANSFVFNSSTNTFYAGYSDTEPANYRLGEVRKLVVVDPTITGTTTLCNGASTTLSCATPGGSWQAGSCDQLSVNASTGAVTALATGNPIVYYRVGQCNVPVTLTVNPFAGNIVGDRMVNVGSSINMATTGVPGGTWSSSNASVAAVGTGGIVSGVATGTVTISYSTSGSCGTDLATAVVSVNPLGTCKAWNIIGGSEWDFVPNNRNGFDQNGTPYVVFTDNEHGQKLTVRKFVSGVWTDVGTPGFTDGGIVGNFAIAIQSNGTPFVAYEDSAVSWAVTVKKFNGTGWETVGTPGINSSYVQKLSIAVTACGTPYVAFSSMFEKMLTFNGTSWVDISANLPPYFEEFDVLDVEVSTENTPYIICKEPSDNNASLMQYNGEEWQYVGASHFASEAIDDAELTLGNGNVPYVSLKTSAASSVVVMKYNGSSWSSLAATGATAYISDVVVDPLGVPYLAYPNDYGKQIVLKYNGSSWDTILSGTANMNDGGRHCLALNTDGIPYLICGDYWGNLMLTTPGNFDPAISGTLTVAVGGTTTLSSISRSGIWSSSDTYVAFMAGNMVVGYHSGTATITYTNGSCLATVVVTVGSPCSVASISGSATLCAGATTTFTDSTAGGTWSSTAASIANVGSGTGIVAGVSAGTADIRYTAGTCMVSKTVTITPLPSAGTITGTATVCTGNTITLNNAATGGTWNSSDPSTATVGSSSGIVSGISTGNATITYTVTNGCGSATTIQVVTVNATPSAGTITGAASVCTGNTTTLNNATPGGTWSSDNISAAAVGSATGIVSGVAAGNAAITYTVTNGCGSAMATQVVTVNATPSAGTITGTASVCTGNSTTLDNTTSGGTWTSSNTSVATVNSATGIVSGITTGNAAITYTVINGCGSATTIQVVTVNATPSAGTITGAASVCTGNTTTLNNATPGGTWSSSNTTIATVGSSSGMVTGVAAGTVIITYTVVTGCGSAIATKVVTVDPTPSAGTITGTLTVCNGNSTTLTNVTSGGTWNTSNSSVATVNSSGVVTGVATGNATITYTVTTGCGSATATKIVTVNPASSAGTITGTASICIGGIATLANTTTGGTWSSSNSAVATVNSSTGVASGITSGTATITYAVSGACGSATATKVVTVGATASITGALALCAGMTSVLSGGASGGTWSSSNTAVATVGASSGVLTAVATGTANITYSTGTGCSASAVVSVSMPASIAGTANACVGQTSALTDATPGGTWTSNNTAIATVDAGTGVVTGISAGTTTISYSVSAGCYRVSSFIVKALPPSVATPVTVCVSSTLNIPPPSSNGLSWTSSNTSVATIGSSSGVLTGISAGTTTLTYTTNTGCFVTTVATVNTAPAISGTTSLCIGSVSTLSSATTGGNWTSNNTAIASVISSTGVVTGVGAGTATITYNTTGCRSTAIATVNSLPAVIAGTLNACVAQSATLTDATLGGTWTSNNTSIATVDPSTGIATGVAAGTTTMTYTLSTGCSRMGTFTVKALPPAIVTPIAACVGTTTAIAPPSTNGKSWSSSNTGVATIGSSSGILTGVTTGTTTLTYTTTTGCFVTTESTVYPTPSAGTITGPSTLVLGNTITLDDAAVGGIWSSSNTARATIGSSTGVVTGVGGGTATISYSVSNPGCTVRATQVVHVTFSRPEGNSVTVSSIQLYPNPTTGAFTLVTEEAGTLQLFTMDGKAITSYAISVGTNPLDLPAELATGIYMCRFTGEKGNTTMVRLVYER